MFPNDTASTEDNFFDFVPEIKLRDDVVLSLGASYRDRHAADYYDYGGGSYYEEKRELQTYAFTPKVVVSTPIGGMKNVFVIGADYDRNPTTVSTSSELFSALPSRRATSTRRTSPAMRTRRYIRCRTSPWRRATEDKSLPSTSTTRTSPTLSSVRQAHRVTTGTPTACPPTTRSSRRRTSLLPTARASASL